MILYEYEGKQILASKGLKTPKSQLITNSEEVIPLNPPLVLKAQSLSGKRAHAGGIVFVNESDKLRPSLERLFSQQINQERIEKVLIEEKIDIAQEYYLSLTYDSSTRGPVLVFSSMGGTDIENRGGDKIPYSIVQREFLDKLPEELPADLINSLLDLFFTNDLLLLEINPLVKTTKGEWYALDAKIKLDDASTSRHKDWGYSPRSVPGHTPSENEIKAKRIDEEDYRGVAGSTYFDLEGDIAILASGGGASLTALDALNAVGGKPANYTEYGGNPPREKVQKLTEIVLSKKNIHALWVVGAIANFTDIYETLSGFVEGLKNLRSSGLKIDFPIVIRRGGPRDQEAFKMLSEQKDFDFYVYGEETTISESAKIVAQKAKEFAQK